MGLAAGSSRAAAIAAATLAGVLQGWHPSEPASFRASILQDWHPSELASCGQIPRLEEVRGSQHLCLSQLHRALMFRPSRLAAEMGSSCCSKFCWPETPWRGLPLAQGHSPAPPVPPAAGCAHKTMQQFIFHSSFHLSSVQISQKALIPLSRHQLENLRLLHLAVPQVSPFPRLVFSGT